MFGWDDAFLLSMQAAGAIISAVQAKDQKGLIQMGRQLENAALDTNLEAIRTQNSESSLEAIKALRENVSNQIVINAARGVSTGAGSAQVALMDSESAFGQDEKTRRMNLLSKENELRAAGVLSGLHTLTSETKVGQSLTNQIFKNLPISTLADKFKVGSKVKSGLEGVGTYISKKGGFGLNTIGS